MLYLVLLRLWPSHSGAGPERDSRTDPEWEQTLASGLTFSFTCNPSISVWELRLAQSATFQREGILFLGRKLRAPCRALTSPLQGFCFWPGSLWGNPWNMHSPSAPNSPSTPNSGISTCTTYRYWKHQCTPNNSWGICHISYNDNTMYRSRHWPGNAQMCLSRPPLICTHHLWEDSKYAAIRRCQKLKRGNLIWEKPNIVEFYTLIFAFLLVNRASSPVLNFSFGLPSLLELGSPLTSVLNRIHSLMKNGQNVRPWRS